MKKITVSQRYEEAEFTCDSCGKQAFGQLQMHFWYGSKMDLSQGTVHLCDECAQKVIDSLKSNFGIDVQLKEITEL